MCLLSPLTLTNKHVNVCQICLICIKKTQNVGNTSCGFMSVHVLLEPVTQVDQKVFTKLESYA